MSPNDTITDDALLDIADPFADGPQTREAAPWIEDARRQFQAIAELPCNWDGDNALPPKRGVIDGGFCLLVCLSCGGDISKPHINPTRDGGVQMEWEVGTRSFEIEVVGLGAASYFYQDLTGVEEEGEIFVREQLDTVIRMIKRVENAG
ncbi:MAG: hypothetical protein HQ581_21315 [Planctomycetes bacterium]|nr:hypothetical protein [Planctomycetota bacterium]